MLAGLDDKGRPCKDYSIHDQVMAIILDIASPAHKDMLEKKLLPYIRGQNTIGAVPSAFWVTYLFEVLGKFGYGNEVVEFIRHKWAPMTKTFSTWEAYPPEHFDNYGKIGVITSYSIHYTKLYELNMMARCNSDAISSTTLLTPIRRPVSRCDRSPLENRFILTQCTDRRITSYNVCYTKLLRSALFPPPVTISELARNVPITQP